MTDRNTDDELENLTNDFDSTFDQSNENQRKAEASDNKEKLSKEDLEEQFDGEYVASPTGTTQHLVEIDASQTLCTKDLREKEWQQSSEPGPFNPICKKCKSALAGPVEPTSEAGLGSLNEIRNWYAKRIDIRSAEEAHNSALTKAELQIAAKYIQSLESDNESEI